MEENGGSDEVTMGGNVAGVVNIVTLARFGRGRFRGMSSGENEMTKKTLPMISEIHWLVSNAPHV